MFPKLSFWHYLLLLFPVTAVANYYHSPTVVIFVLSAAVLVPLAFFLSKATESLSVKTNEHLTGIINVTFGNTAELVIAIFAVKSGLLDIVKYALIGAIIGKILSVLGLSILVGGIKHGELELDPDITGHTIIYLAMASMCFAIPTVFAREDTIPIINKYSINLAIVLLVVYFLGIFYTVMNQNQIEPFIATTHIHAISWV